MSTRTKRKIVILTGAGISKESGINTFRDQGGLWEKNRIEDVATATALRADPVRVNGFYNDRRRGMSDPAIVPNAAHFALAKLESQWGDDVLLVTQNIDDLHERAGSKGVVHMHGSLGEAECGRCDSSFPWREDVLVTSRCRICGETGYLRPHVVLFEEMPFRMDQINRAAKECGLFVAIGTSGHVYPAAGLVGKARMRGAHTIELNLERSAVGDAFLEGRYGPASEVVPAFVDQLLARGHWLPEN